MPSMWDIVTSAGGEPRYEGDQALLFEFAKAAGGCGALVAAAVLGQEVAPESMREAVVRFQRQYVLMCVRLGIEPT